VCRDGVRSPPMRTRTKLLLLGSLYLSQGLPYGFFTQALPVLLRDQGLSLPLIGLAQLLSLPWALKFLWAPYLDRVTAPRFGKRRSVIVPLQLASCVVLATLALASTPGALWPLSIAILLVNLISATQDIATDGLAVEVLSPDERGLGNGLQVGAYRIGMIIGGGFILWLFARTGWTVSFLAMAGWLLLATLPILWFREPFAAATLEAPPAPAGAISAAFKRLGPWLVVLATFKTGEWFATGMLRTFFTDAFTVMRTAERGMVGGSHGELPAGQADPYVLEQLSYILGYVGFSCALVGALIGGALARVLGRRRALLLFGALQTLAIAAMALATVSPSVGMFYAISAAEHLTSAMATAALFTAMMDFCRAEHAGTDYTVQASLVVIATGTASILSGFSAGAIGYGGHFLAAAGLSAVGVIAVATYRARDGALKLL
jgi:PAT family beta-lactamase induction signal transducer AmpG